MTIEKWLDKRIENAREDCLNQDIETYEDGYAEGYKDALQLVRDKLPFLDHEVTLREVKEECKDCVFCPFCADDDLNCMFKQTPEHWDIDDIQKRMKEARDD